MSEIYVLVARELKKWYRTRVLLIVTIIQPILWIGLFGKAMNITGILRIPDEVLNSMPPYVTSRLREIFNEIVADFFGVPNIDYFSYMAIGMLTIIILFTSMFSGMSIAWDRRTGFLYRLLASPIRRSSILLSKVFASVFRGLLQALLIFLVALAFGLRLNPAPPHIVLAAVASLILLSIGMSSMFVSLTARMRSWEAHVGLMNLVSMPLMFASDVLYPFKMMPEWLRTVAMYNPLSFAADVLREALLYGDAYHPAIVLSNFIKLLAFSAIFTGLCILVSRRAFREL